MSELKKRTKTYYIVVHCSKTSETEDMIPIVDEFKVPEFSIILLFSPKIADPSIALTVE